jgi:hypothetical protein
VKDDVLVGGDREQTGRVVPRLKNAPCPSAGQVDRPKQLPGQFVEALPDDITVEKESSLHATFQLRVHGQEELVALQANTGLARFVQGLTVDDLRGKSGGRQNRSQAKDS